MNEMNSMFVETNAFIYNKSLEQQEIYTYINLEIFFPS